MLIIKNKEFRNNGVFFDYHDDIKNTDNLILKTGIPKFKIDDCLEKYVSDNKRHIITISQINNYYVCIAYTCMIGHSESIKTVFKNMVPHWYNDPDDLCCARDTLVEAKQKAVEELNFINNSFTYNGTKMIYFIFPNDRIGTAYHEFQTGNKKNIFWDHTSILISEEFMEETKLGDFLAKVIPNYDYFGDTVINKELWRKIKIESNNENDVIKEVINEMKEWAENSINLYGCFTIKGI